MHIFIVFILHVSVSCAPSSGRTIKPFNLKSHYVTKLFNVVSMAVTS